MTDDQTLLLFLVILPLVSFLVLHLFKTNQKSSLILLPPGPSQLPVIGNLHQLPKNTLPHISLQRLSDEYGPLMFLQLGSIPTLVISSADVIKTIFKSHDLIFSNRPDMFAADKISYGRKSITFSPYDDYWREARKITILELLSSKRVQSFQTVRKEEVDSMVRFVARSASSVVDVSRLAHLLANNIVCRVTFGRKKLDDGSGGGRFDNLMRETQALLGTPSVADFFPWLDWINNFNGRNRSLEKHFTELDRFLDEEIQSHQDPERVKSEYEDFLDVLFQVVKDSKQQFVRKIDHIKAIVTDIFFAGTDTSSTTLVWTMTELIRNPSMMKKAQIEVREVAEGKEKVEEDDLPKLMYLKLVLKEVMRLHPPAPLLVPRETTDECTVEGYRIPRKTRVMINAKAIAMDPKYWKNPEQFRPERFLNSSVDFKGQHFELIPFGLGRRGCPGIQFSIPLVELAIANMLYRFDWELPPGITSEDLNMEEAFGITMIKKDHLHLVAKPAIL